MTERGWGRPFEDPIEVTTANWLTLRDAGEYIAALPKAEHDAPEWQTAMEVLLGPTGSSNVTGTEVLRRNGPDGYMPRFDRAAASGDV